VASALREARTVCSFCGVGCGVIATAEGGRLVGVRGDPDHPSSRGRLCTKGLALHETVHLPDRLLHPQLRAAKGGSLARLAWDDAVARVAGALRGARGPDAIGFYLSGQLLTEDYYAFNKLAKGFLGTNHVDSNSRLCMSSAVSGYRRAFGVDAPPCCYDDLERADLILAVGANLAWCHPVLLRRIEAARAARAGRPRLVVVDPRRTVAWSGSVTAGFVATIQRTSSPPSAACSKSSTAVRPGAAAISPPPQKRSSSRRSVSEASSRCADRSVAIAPTSRPPIAFG